MSSDTTFTNSRLTIPITPAFSTGNTSSAPRSEATSDERPDLGAFTAILRAWNPLQPPPRIPLPQSHSSPSSQPSGTDRFSSISSFARPRLSEATGADSPNPEATETVWAQHQLQSYFSLNSITPLSEREQELGDDEYDISLDNGTVGSLPHHSPFSDAPRTIDIAEAPSDNDAQQTRSLPESQVDRHIRRVAMAMPVTVYTPNHDPTNLSALYSAARGTDRSSLASREMHPSYPSYAFQRSSSYQVPSTQDNSRRTDQSVPSESLQTRSLWPTPPHVHRQPHAHPSRRNGPLDDRSSSNNLDDDPESAVLILLSQARARTLVNDKSSKAPSSTHETSSHSTPDSGSHPFGSHPHSLSLLSQRHPPSPSFTSNAYYRYVQDTLSGSRPHPASFSPQVEPPSPQPSPEGLKNVLQLAPEDDDSKTPTRADHICQRESETERYLREGVAHPYPHSLKGHRGLPPTLCQEDSCEVSNPLRQLVPPGPVEDDPYSAASEAEHDLDHPSLGLLDEALGFIAAERARREAARAAGLHQGIDGTTPSAEAQQFSDPTDLPTKRKRRRKKPVKAPDETGIQQTDSFSGLSATRPLLLATGPGPDQDSHRSMKEGDTPTKQITILSRPKPCSSSEDTKVELLEPLVLKGKNGNRVGRKERERAKARRDKERLALEQAAARAEDDWDADNDDLDDDDEEGGDGEVGHGESEGHVGGRPASAGARAYVHHELGKGAYRSTPATLGTVTPTRMTCDMASKEGAKPVKGDDGSDEDHGPATVGSSPKSARTRRKTRKRAKALAHAKSFPNLRQHASTFDLEDEDAPDDIVPVLDQNKRSRLVGLACKLRLVFPEQQKDLTRIVQRLESAGRKPTALAPAGTGAASGMSLGRRRSRHSRNGSKGGSGTTAASFAAYSNDSNGVDEIEQDLAELDVVNKGPLAEGGPLIHVFIDHSNILIGLLNFLKRSPPPPGVVSDYLTSQGAKSAGLSDGAASHPLSVSKAITIPQSSGNRSNALKKSLEPIPVIESPPSSSILKHSGTETSPIPLPSFATVKKSGAATAAGPQVSWEKDLEMSKSLPTGSSGLHAHMAAMRRRNGNGAEQKSIHGVISDGCEDEQHSGRRKEDGEVVISGAEVAGHCGEDHNGKKDAKKFPRHLWHAAFVLVLERGRAVSRRVVVTSSPLYQPMEKIQNLGYEVRVYIRVPDLGDGMDRERKDAKYSATRPSYGGRGSVTLKKTHARHVSGSTSAESGSAGGSSVNLNALQHHGAGSATPPTSAGNGSTTAAINKVKYREQGVDELLQLKLHQAIADVDVVPKGSTIVLATGDGNVGQFNEDGFLGPVRTALKRGWKVELYAWEDGLSRSWRREFGENSEWGRKGLFRIIPLEQFATSLVEASGW